MRIWRKSPGNENCTFLTNLSKEHACIDHLLFTGKENAHEFTISLHLIILISKRVNNCWLICSILCVPECPFWDLF